MASTIEFTWEQLLCWQVIPKDLSENHHSIQTVQEAGAHLPHLQQ